MRTLYEIIEAIKTNQPVTTEEATTYSTLVLTYLMNMQTAKFKEECMNWRGEEPYEDD